MTTWFEELRRYEGCVRVARSAEDFAAAIRAANLEGARDAERLRDRVALRDLDGILITAPDRLARNYVHQVLLLEEITATGCQVHFLDRPMSQDPHDQLLLQIRGAVAEYERSLIAERMRRGRLRKLQAGVLLPWVRVPYGYRVDPDRRAVGELERPGDVTSQRLQLFLELPAIRLIAGARRGLRIEHDLE